MFQLFYTTKFKKDIKRYRLDFDLISTFLKTLQEKGVLGVSQKLKPHRLKGKYKDNWECHIKPDLLIIWLQANQDKKITLVRIGSHADLF